LGSRRFGDVLSTTLTGFRETEPHHTGLSFDGKTLAAGSLLSIFNPAQIKPPDIFLFDVGTDPLSPRLKSTITGREGGGTDAFVPFGQSGFLTTLMTNRQGAAEGRIGVIDGDGRLIREVGPSAQDERAGEFNPHGIAYFKKYDRLVTVDFVALDSLVKTDDPPNPAFRQTVRIYRLSTLEMLKTLELPDALAVMDVTALPHTRGLFLTSNGFGKFFIVDSLRLSVSPDPVYALDDAIPPAEPADIPGHCLLQILQGGKKVLITSYGLSQLRLVDMSNPYRPKQLQRYTMQLQPNDVGYTSAPGPHLVTVDASERLIAVSNYFVQDGRTIVTEQGGFPGDKTIRFFQLAPNKKSFRPHATLPVMDFRRIVGARAHGMNFKTFRGRTNSDGECMPNT
jgi:hypothetical protein